MITFGLQIYHLSQLNSSSTFAVAVGVALSSYCATVKS